MKLKKLGAISVVVLWIFTLIISFFIGMTYHWASTTEIKTTKDYGQIKEITNKSEVVEVPVSDVESIAKEEGITKEEAEQLCQEVLGDKDEENSFPISYRCIGAVSANNKLYYVMHIAWLVDNNHWSYIGNCYVSSDGKEIYDGIVSPAKYEMTELKWSK